LLENAVAANLPNRTRDDFISQRIRQLVGHAVYDPRTGRIPESAREDGYSVRLEGSDFAGGGLNRLAEIREGVVEDDDVAFHKLAQAASSSGESQSLASGSLLVVSFLLGPPGH
jgi:hypothetical protein